MSRTTAQKAQHAAAERARRLARKGNEVAAAEEFIDTAIAETRPVLTVVPDMPKSAKPELYLRAVAAKKAGKRGKGVKVSDEILARFAASLRDEGYPVAQALEVAYWINGFAFSTPRFRKVWASLAEPVAEVG